MKCFVLYNDDQYTCKRTFKTLFASVVVLCGIMTGCDSSKESKTSSTTPSAQQEKTSQDRKLESSQLLGSILASLQPESMSLTSQGENAVSLLQQWGRVNLDADASDPSLDQVLATLENIPPASLEDVKESRFLTRDAEHIRDCLMFQKISNDVTDGTRDDLTAVVALFEYVMRNIALAENQELKLGVPFSINEVMLRGRGSVENRIWLFANLLRQQRIDSVLIVPKAAADAKTFYPLIGVYLNKEFYLFDPFLGTPIPAADDMPPKAKGSTPDKDEKPTLLVQTPATLKAALADDQLFRRLDLNEKSKYPLSADQFKTIVAFVISDAGYWSKRMHALQQSLIGEQSMIVSDVLHDFQIGDSGDSANKEAGAISRIAEAGSEYWKPENVSVWNHPEQSLYFSNHRNDKQQQIRDAMFMPFLAPMRVKTNPENQQMQIGKPEEMQYKTRISQLMGDYATAVAKYSSIRLDCRTFRTIRVDQNILRMHEAAFDDALYWTGLCHMQEDNISAAISTFSQYINPNRKGLGPSWISQAVINQAICFARIGDFSSAVGTLKLLPPQSSSFPAAQHLVKRWMAAAGLPKPQEKPKASEGEKPAGPLVAPLPADE